MPLSEGGTDQDLLGCASVTSLKTVASGKMPKETVVISQLVDDAFGRFPSIIDGPDHLPKEWLFHRGPGNQRQVMSRGVVAGIVQPVGIGKMAVGGPQFGGPTSHLLGKSLD